MVYLPIVNVNYPFFEEKKHKQPSHSTTKQCSDQVDLRTQLHQRLWHWTDDWNNHEPWRGSYYCSNQMGKLADTFLFRTISPSQEAWQIGTTQLFSEEDF